MGRRRVGVSLGAPPSSAHCYATQRARTVAVSQPKWPYQKCQKHKDAKPKSGVDCSHARSVLQSIQGRACGRHAARPGCRDLGFAPQGRCRRPSCAFWSLRFFSIDERFEGLGSSCDTAQWLRARGAAPFPISAICGPSTVVLRSNCSMFLHLG